MVRDCLARIARDDPGLNAFTDVWAEDALRAAAGVDAHPRRADLPLAGVPVAVKADIDVAGHPTTHGTPANLCAARDHGVVRLLREAGAIVVGATTMPELALIAITESRRYGITHNPVAPGRTPGGSSGGAAAAVAAGMVPIAIGEDGCGSIRAPASCTGIVGLKPQRGRLPAAPPVGAWGALLTLGPLARDAGDVALVHEVITSQRPGPSWEPAALARPLRIGWTISSPDRRTRVDPGVAAATHRFAETLAAAGHQVRPLTPRWPRYRFIAFTQYFAGAYRVARTLPRQTRLEPLTRRIVFTGRVTPSPNYRWAIAASTAVTDKVESLLEGIDVLLTPTLPVPPPPAGLLGRDAEVTRLSHQMVSFTQVFNVSGHPAISVPCATTPEGWPIGVQLVAHAGREDDLLALAGSLPGDPPVSE